MFTTGTDFKISIFGESHSESLGILIRGCPKGIMLNSHDLSDIIDRRRPVTIFSTSRKESDFPHFLTGLEKYPKGNDNLFITTGAPITISFHNSNVRSRDYEIHLRHPRPGHADIYSLLKYSGENNPSGGGFFSGRMTLPLCAAGWVAKGIVNSFMPEYRVKSVFKRIGSLDLIDSKTSLMPDETQLKIFLKDKEHELTEYLQEIVKQKDSIGGIINCSAKGIISGLGEPFFNSAESMLSSLLFSIPGVKAIEFGAGFKGSKMKGSDFNDPVNDALGHTDTNNCGGVIGGITTGNPLKFNVSFRPTSSIEKEQSTYDIMDKKKNELVIKGRHDACFLLRTPVIVESVVSIALADMCLCQHKRDEQYFKKNRSKEIFDFVKSNKNSEINKNTNTAKTENYNVDPHANEQFLLQRFRTEIESIDSTLLTLIDQRMKLCLEVGKVKEKTGQDIDVPEREKFLLNKMKNKAKADNSELSSAFIEDMWKNIFNESKRIQQKKIQK